MGGIQGIQLNPGGGILVAGDYGVGGQFSLTGGISVGVAGDPLDIGYDLIQVPINLNISRWGPGTWNYGGETGIRFDVFVTNIDVLAKLGAIHGEGETSFALAPTFKIGFIKDFFGFEVSPMAVSSHEYVHPGRTYIGAYINLAWIPSVLTGFYQIGSKHVGFGDRDVDFDPPTFSPSEYDDYEYSYERTETHTTPSGETEVTEHYEYNSYSEPDPDLEGPPAPEARPSTRSAAEMLSLSGDAETCLSAAGGSLKGANDYETQRRQGIYSSCMEMTDACMNTTPPITLSTDVGPVSFDTVDECIEKSGKLAALGYKLQ
jgi:hypothetical protein